MPSPVGYLTPGPWHWHRRSVKLDLDRDRLLIHLLTHGADLRVGPVALAIAAMVQVYRGKDRGIDQRSTPWGPGVRTGGRPKGLEDRGACG